MAKIDFAKLAQNLTNPWEPIEVIRMNGFHVLLALFHGQYKFHQHDGDEMFFVLSGEIEIELENETVKLKQGEGYLLPKNTIHRSQAKTPSIVMAIERANLKTIWTQPAK